MNASSLKPIYTNKTLLATLIISVGLLLSSTGHSEEKANKHSSESCSHKKSTSHQQCQHKQRRKHGKALLHDLDLNEQQESNIKKIKKESQESSKTLRKAMQEKEKAIQSELSKNGFIESNIRTLAEQKAAIMVDQIILQSKTTNLIRSELNDDQKIKFDFLIVV